MEAMTPPPFKFLSTTDTGQWIQKSCQNRGPFFPSARLLLRESGVSPRPDRTTEIRYDGNASCRAGRWISPYSEFASKNLEAMTTSSLPLVRSCPPKRHRWMCQGRTSAGGTGRLRPDTGRPQAWGIPTGGQKSCPKETAARGGVRTRASGRGVSLRRFLGPRRVS
jgi:hypothetical protein